MPRNEAFAIPCPTCGGAGFFGDGPVGYLCLDCMGSGELEADAPEFPDTGALLEAQDCAILKMPPSMADAMADLSAALAELRGGGLRRAA